MGRAVYIKKGPGNWLAGSAFLAVCVGVLWTVWQALRFGWRHQARTVVALATVGVGLLIGVENLALVAVAAGAGAGIWWAWWPVSFARWVGDPCQFVWRRGGYRRNWKLMTFGCGLAHRHSEHPLLTH